MTTHKLIGGYGHSATLGQVEDKKWKFTPVEKNFVRYRRNTEGVTFVDPLGGPLISKGFIFLDITVASIVVEDKITYLITE